MSPSNGKNAAWRVSRRERGSRREWNPRERMRGSVQESWHGPAETPVEPQGTQYDGVVTVVRPLYLAEKTD